MVERLFRSDDCILLCGQIDVAAQSETDSITIAGSIRMRINQRIHRRLQQSRALQLETSDDLAKVLHELIRISPLHRRSPVRLIADYEVVGISYFLLPLAGQDELSGGLDVVSAAATHAVVGFTLYLGVPTAQSEVVEFLTNDNSHISLL